MIERMFLLKITNKDTLTREQWELACCLKMEHRDCSPPCLSVPENFVHVINIWCRELPLSKTVISQRQVDPTATLTKS